MIKRPPRPPENHERWLVSYADFITLLFAFFVVMFATSEVNRKKVGQFSHAYSTYLEGGQEALTALSEESAKAAAAAEDGDGGGPELGPLQRSVEQLLRELIKDDKIKLKLEQRGLVISLKEAALFPAGGASFREGSAALLQKVAAALSLAEGRQVRLEGHTDDRPIRNARFPSNWELSSARAIGVLRALVDQHGFDEDRVAVSGYGAQRPIESNQTEQGRAANRRVDIVILTEGAQADEPERGDPAIR